MDQGIKITELPLAGPLVGGEVVVGVQAGETRRFDAAAFAGGDPVATTPGLYLMVAVAVTVGQVLALRADGMAELASAENLSHASMVAGVALASAMAGSTVGVARVGAVMGSWSFVPGGRVYLGLFGELTQSPDVGAFQLDLGVAAAPDRVLFQPGLAIVRM